jgi:hypothetical protein
VRPLAPQNTEASWLREFSWFLVREPSDLKSIASLRPPASQRCFSESPRSDVASRQIPPGR